MNLFPGDVVCAVGMGIMWCGSAVPGVCNNDTRVGDMQDCVGIVISTRNQDNLRRDGTFQECLVLCNDAVGWMLTGTLRQVKL